MKIFKAIIVRVTQDVEILYETARDLHAAKLRLVEDPPHKNVVTSGNDGSFGIKTTGKNVLVRSVK